MKNLLILFVVAIAVVSCKKVTLDAFAFPSETLSAYEFESYSGEWELDVPSTVLAESTNYTLVELESLDSETLWTNKIYGVYIGDVNTIASDTIILYLHGQSKHMDNYFDRASLLANLGGKYNYSIFMIDYRGYGMSEGESTEHGLYEDADAAIDWLKARGASGDRTMVYGYSLGAIPAIDRAAYREDFKFSKLIIESPLASVQHLVQNSTLINVDAGYVTTLEFNNAEKIKDVTAPLMWLHGEEDDYISIDNGELIYNNHGGTNKKAIRVEGGTHTDLPSVIGYADYLQQVLTFIKN